MPRKLCTSCGQWLGGNLDWQKHLLSDRHQERLNQLTRQKNAEQFGIYVGGFFHEKDITLEKLKALFSQFGEVVQGYLGRSRSFAILEYKCREDALKALNSSVYYNNSELIVRPRNSKNPTSDRSAATTPTPTPCPLPSPEGSWEQQAQRLATTLGIPQRFVPPEQNRQLQEVCRAVRKALSPTFYDCRTHVFGSCCTGLARSDSDVDIYVDISKCEYMNYLSPHDEATLRNDPHQFYQNMFTKCRKMLLHCRMFTNVVGVPQARTPVIKCVHSPTQVQCDLTFKNCLSVSNSQLLKYFFELDPRIKAMVMVLRHWAQVIPIRNLSNYALTLMVFFYLRRLPQRMVPSIQTMINSHEEPCYAEGWRCSFNKVFFQSQNTQTLQELLHGFFTFVSNFDFGVDVMCLLDAEAVPKWQFLEASTLPPSQALLAEAMEYDQALVVRSPMCVQDPFELSHNTTRNVGKKNLTDLQECCVAAAKLCSEPSNSLSEMLQAKPEPPIWTPEIGNRLSVLFYNYFPLSNLLKAGTEIRDIWCEDLLVVIKDVFKLVLCFEEVGEEATKNQLQKLSFTDKPLTLKLSSKYCMWSSRKSAKKDMEPTGSIAMFAKEVAVTQFLLKTYYKNPEGWTKPSITIDVILKVEKCPTRLEIQIVGVNSEPSKVTGLMSFLNSNLQTLVDKGLTEDYKKDLLPSKVDGDNENKKKAVAAKRNIEPFQKDQESRRARLNLEETMETKNTTPTSDSELSTLSTEGSSPSMTSAKGQFQLVTSHSYKPPVLEQSPPLSVPSVSLSDKPTVCSLSSNNQKMYNVPKQSPLNFLLKPSEIKSLQEDAAENASTISSSVNNDEMTNSSSVGAVDTPSIKSDNTTLASFSVEMNIPSVGGKNVLKRSTFGPQQRRTFAMKDKSSKNVSTLAAVSTDSSLQEQTSPQASSSSQPGGSASCDPRELATPSVLPQTSSPLGIPLRRPNLPSTPLRRPNLPSTPLRRPNLPRAT